MINAAAVSTLALGLGIGLVLIVSIGAQNAYILQRSIRGDVPMLPIVGVCVAGEAVLITAGVGGVGLLVSSHEWVLDVMRYLGAAFLAGYGLLSLRRAARSGEGLVAAEQPSAPTLLGALTAMFAFTFLNPHAWIDAAVFLGGIAAQQGPELKWWFAAGAFVAGTIWYCLLGFGGATLRRFFARQGAWRVLDGVVGVTMLGLAVVLLTG